MAKCKLYNNHAERGGGIDLSSCNYTAIENTIFNYNNASIGGGIYVNATLADIQGTFYYNKAHNGSAIYTNTTNLKIHDSIFDKNQAWSYLLPINVISQGSNSNITIRLKGGDNIANAIYNALGVNSIIINNITYLFRDFNNSTTLVSTPKADLNPKESPINTNGVYLPYQYDWEDNQIINVSVINNKTGEIVVNKSLITDSRGFVYLNLYNLKIGEYNVLAIHPEDNYYTARNNGSLINVKYLDLSITKTVSDKGPVYVGSNVIWTITVFNKGSDNAYDVFVRDVLPSGLKYLSHNASAGVYDHLTGLWTIGTLNKGQSVSLSIVTIAVSAGNITNGAVVNTSSNDTNESNNVANNTTEVLNMVDLEINKFSNKKAYYLGDKVIWIIKVKNNGPCKAVDAYVIDKLPSGFKYLSSSLSKGSYDVNTEKWYIGNLTKGENVFLKIITKAEKLGYSTNIAIVNNTITDINASNNEDNFTVNVIKKEIPSKPKKPHNHTIPEPNKNPSKDFIASNSTGNPLVLVLLAIFIVFVNIFIRKNK